MIIKGFVDYSGNAPSHGNKVDYNSAIGSFSKGFTEGYLTMDAIAAIAFSMIVVNAIKATGLNMQIKYLKQTVMSGLIAAIALVFIYVSLGFIGNHMNVDNATLKI